MSEVFDKIAQIEKLLEEVKGLIAVGQYQTPTPSTFKQPPEGVRVQDSSKKEETKTFNYGAPTIEDLEKAQVDMSVIDYLDLGKKLKPKKWLGDAFGNFNETLKSFNYKYDGTEKAWLFQRSDEVARTSQPKKATGATGKTPKITRISDIAENQRSANIEGELQFDPETYDRETGQGPTTVTDIKISDGSATAKLSFWGERKNMIVGFVKGDKIQVESLMVGKPYQGMPQLTAGKYTRIVKL